MSGEAKAPTIEERLGIAVKERDKAGQEMKRLGLLLNKKTSLKLNFRDLMNLSDSEFRRENNVTINDFDSLRLNDLTLTAVYELCSQYGSYVLNDDLKYQVRDVASKYLDKARHRTLTEAEYNSLANATEPFIGRYIQRVYDVLRANAEEDQRKITYEESQWNAQHKKPEPKPKQETSQTPSLLKRIFGGWRR